MILLQGGIAAPTFYNDLVALGLTSSLRLCLDAGALASYPGTGQKWLDLSGGGYDFMLGSETAGGSTGDEPTFNGSAGGLSSSEYFSFDGGDYFKYDSAAEPWMTALTENNALYSALIWIRPTGSGAQSWLSTHNTGGYQGIQWYANSGASTLVVLHGSGHMLYTASSVSATNSFTAENWHLLGLSFNEADGTDGGFLYRDGAYDPVATHGDRWPGTLSGPGTFGSPMEIGASRNNGINRLASGSRVAGVMMWQGMALTKGQMDTIWNRQKARFGL